jgi:hypothetical protein
MVLSKTCLRETLTTTVVSSNNQQAFRGDNASHYTHYVYSHNLRIFSKLRLGKIDYSSHFGQKKGG